MTGFQIGDRVRLKPETAEGWLLPLRRFAKEGRIATVKSLPGEWSRYYWIEFDVKRKGARPERASVCARDIEMAPSK